MLLTYPTFSFSSSSGRPAATLPAALFTLATALSAGGGAESDISFNPQEATISDLRKPL